MTFAVTARCIGCKDTACVGPCPMACFREGPDFLVIDPDECIDCAMCVPACPVDAIRADAELDAADAVFVERTVRLARSRDWPRLVVPRARAVPT